MEKLTWVMELWDKFSGPAERIRKAILGVEKSQFTLMKGLQKMGGEVLGRAGDFVQLSGRASAMVGVLGAVASGIGAIVVAAAAAGAAVLALGTAFSYSMVKTLAFKESALVSFELMTGSRDAGTKMFLQAVDFAAKTPFETDAVITAFKALKGAGFSDEEVPLLFNAMGDVAAAGGDMSGEVIQRIAIQMAQVKALGKLQSGDLKVMANQMASAGIGLSQVYAKIAQNLNIGVDQVGDAIERGDVNANVGILSIVQAIGEKSGGTPGGIMAAQSKTLLGLWSTLKSSWETLIFSMSTRVDQMPGVKALKGFMSNLITLFDATSASGKKLMGSMERIFNSLVVAIFGRMGDQSFLETMEVWLGKGADWVEKNAHKIAGAITTLKDVGVELMNYVKNAEKNGFASAFGELFVNVGKSIMSGIARGMKMQMYEALGTNGMILAMLLEQWEGPKGLNTGSPSRKMAQLGRWTVEGYEKGVTSRPPNFSMDDIIAPSQGLSTPKPGFSLNDIIAPAQASANKSADMAPNIALTIQVDNAGHHDGEAIADRLADLLPGKLAGIFERLSLEAGT